MTSFDDSAFTEFSIDLDLSENDNEYFFEDDPTSPEDDIFVLPLPLMGLDVNSNHRHGRERKWTVFDKTSADFLPVRTLNFYLFCNFTRF